jgi:hypothetical protein
VTIKCPWFLVGNKAGQKGRRKAEAKASQSAIDNDNSDIDWRPIRLMLRPIWRP